jgi:hypothetical protein
VDLLAKTLVLKSLCGLQIRVGERFAILREETIEVSLSEREREREIHAHTYTHKYTRIPTMSKIHIRNFEQKSVKRLF